MRCNRKGQGPRLGMRSRPDRRGAVLAAVRGGRRLTRTRRGRCRRRCAARAATWPRSPRRSWLPSSGPSSSASSHCSSPRCPPDRRKSQPKTCGSLQQHGFLTLIWVGQVDKAYRHERRASSMNIAGGAQQRRRAPIGAGTGLARGALTSCGRVRRSRPLYIEVGDGGGAAGDI